MLNTYKILPIFNISRTHAWKMTPFLDFAPPIEKYTLFRENG